ncbi:MAG: hypothetical protein GY772_30945, partial [bacterium]|nr:hypothetical protein [bacterium]
PGSSKAKIKEDLITMVAEATGRPRDMIWQERGRDLALRAERLSRLVVEVIARNPTAARAPEGMGLGKNKDQRPWYQLVSPEGTILPISEGEAVAAALPGSDDYSTKALFDRNIHWEAQGRGFTGPLPEEERGRSSSRSSRARSPSRRRRATSEPRRSGAAQSSGWQSGWQSAPKEQEARSWEWTGWQACV